MVNIHPARAGVNLVLVDFDDLDVYLPRMRGGQPCAAPSLACHLRFIPHARGSTRQLRTKAIADAISPACARVNPPNNRHSFSIGNSPCTREGQPAWEYCFATCE